VPKVGKAIRLAVVERNLLLRAWAKRDRLAYQSCERILVELMDSFLDK
jgi:hypothetical protein